MRDIRGWRFRVQRETIDQGEIFHVVAWHQAKDDYIIIDTFTDERKANLCAYRWIEDEQRASALRPVSVLPPSSAPPAAAPVPD